jgi:hypothetical protein
MTRTQWTLGGLLLVQVALILLLRSPFTSASTAARAEPLVAGVSAAAAQRIELTGREDKKVVLAKDADTWRVETLGGFPADGTKIGSLLDTLSAISVGRPLVTSSRYHDTFKLTSDDNEGRVKIWTAAEGEPAVDLIVGDSPNYRIVLVRKADEDPVYEVRGLATYELQPEPADWAVKELVTVKPEQVVGLEITNAAGRFELAKDASGAWQVRSPDAPAGALDSSKVEDLLRVATSLRLAEPVGREEPATQGLDEPAATLVLRWTEAGAGEAAGESLAAPQEVRVRIGKPLAENTAQRYVTRDGFGFTGSVWESSVDRLLQGDVASLLAS